MAARAKSSIGAAFETLLAGEARQMAIYDCEGERSEHTFEHEKQMVTLPPNVVVSPDIQTAKAKYARI